MSHHVREVLNPSDSATAGSKPLSSVLSLGRGAHCYCSISLPHADWWPQRWPSILLTAVEYAATDKSLAASEPQVLSEGRTPPPLWGFVEN